MGGGGGGGAPTCSALQPHRWPPLAPCWPIASTVAHSSPTGHPTTLQCCGEDPLEEKVSVSEWSIINFPVDDQLHVIYIVSQSQSVDR